MNNAPIKDNAREYGPREKITCNLPHSPRYRVSNGESLSTIVDGVLHGLETALCLSFGGYTSTPMVGGWLDDKGNVVHEPGTCYTVSYHLRHDESLEPKRNNAVALFTEAGERLGEEWVHIERSNFQAEHRRTPNGQGEYDNSPSVADAPNVERIRQLDKETRNHINSDARSTDHVRR